MIAMKILKSQNHINHINQKNHSSDIFMINEQYKYSALTSKIIGCAMTVHKALGNGFQEVIYQRALEIEMRLAGIAFGREFEMPIFYRIFPKSTRKANYVNKGFLTHYISRIAQPIQRKFFADSYISEMGTVRFVAKLIWFRSVFRYIKK